MNQILLKSKKSPGQGVQLVQFSKHYVQQYGSNITNYPGYRH